MIAAVHHPVLTIILWIYIQIARDLLELGLPTRIGEGATTGLYRGSFVVVESCCCLDTTALFENAIDVPALDRKEVGTAGGKKISGRKNDKKGLGHLAGVLRSKKTKWEELKNK